MGTRCFSSSCQFQDDRERLFTGKGLRYHGEEPFPVRGNADRRCRHRTRAAVIAKEQHDDAYWVGTWSASPQAVVAPIQFSGQTVRQIVHTSLGGGRVRVRLSNAFGRTAWSSAPRTWPSALVAHRSSRDRRVLKFNGSPTITIPAGALVVSDSVSLDVPALNDLAVSLYLPENVAATTQHAQSQQTTYCRRRATSRVRAR